MTSTDCGEWSASPNVKTAPKVRCWHEAAATVSDKGGNIMSRSAAIVGGARVAYRVQGRGPAIVLVNGTAALDMHWGPVIEEFSKSRTVISLDYSGSGETTDDGGALSLQKLAEQVAAGAA